MPDPMPTDPATTDPVTTGAAAAEPAPSPAGPVIILVQPQLAENIGMTARAMANFGLSELRLVAPKNGWPKKGVREAASGATHILDGAVVYDTLGEAIADLHYVLATTARERGQMKRVFAPDEAMRDVAGRAGQRVGILFGRERSGLDNDEVSRADAIVTFPVDARFSSLNLAQGVLLMSYEWRRAAGLSVLPFTGEMLSPPATREAMASLFTTLEDSLAVAGFYPPEKRDIIARNMRDMLHRMAMTEQDVRTMRGALRALTARGPRAVK
ncbi:RNA methyltransferase [Methylobacterium sp. Leaf465]|uniref:RNA methyltransferase n=1 Tax=Methylobacterium sp. Leaf465 TaxID=1736385 RepID=UPI002413E31A|nr:RNA methyltransferase [Methylobacterium sp. Leaf465]